MITIKRMPLLAILLLIIGACSQTTTSPNLMVQQEINSNWTFKQVGEDEWLPATVPGTVHTDLLANGKIEDPFYRLNELDQQWIDNIMSKYYSQ